MFQSSFIKLSTNNKGLNNLKIAYYITNEVNSNIMHI